MKGLNDISKLSIKDMIKSRVERYPDRTLVKSDGIEYTWKDIDRGSSVIAHELHNLGVGWGSHVALCHTSIVPYFWINFGSAFLHDQRSFPDPAPQLKIG